MFNQSANIELPELPRQLPSKHSYKGVLKDAETPLRLVSFNVNSIATVMQYYPMTKLSSSMRNLNTFYNWLEADVVCLQELKITNPILPGVSQSMNSGSKLLQQHCFLSDYTCFASLPKAKKSYSGVGLYTKKTFPFKIIKVEEGITGFLPVANISTKNYEIIHEGPFKNLQYKTSKGTLVNCYRSDESLGLGGYENIDVLYNDDVERALELDSQGRAIAIELENGLVIFGCYIPANSQLTEEGLLYKMQYLKVLFKRIENLIAQGKSVVLMGDLNVCKDIQDSEEALQLAKRFYSEAKGEKISNDINFEFIKEKPERFFFNQQLMNSNFKIPNNYKGTMLDCIRYLHPKRRKMYTCWNTMKNARAVNAGSRIDYVLLSKNYTDKKIRVLNADILPEIHGSDHCPVYSDLSLDFIFDDKTVVSPQVNRFEAKTFYKLINNDITKMFGTRKIKASNNKENSLISGTKNKIVKPQKTIATMNAKVDGFFKKKDSSTMSSKSSYPESNETSTVMTDVDLYNSDDDEFLPSIDDKVPIESSSERRDFIQQKLDAIKSDVKLQNDLKKHNLNNDIPLFVEAQDAREVGLTVEDKLKRDKLRSLLDSTNGKHAKIPLCRHKEKAIIKVSQTKGKNFGKKFYCCNRPLIVSDSKKRINTDTENEFSCGFFKWVS